MIQVNELESLAKARLNDAVKLHESQRFDGAAYICGYAIELKLKSRICKTLKWHGYPETPKEFENYKSFKTHKFDTLLSLTRIENTIKTNYIHEWSIVKEWNPELRYKPVGFMHRIEMQRFIDSTNTLLRVL